MANTTVNRKIEDGSRNLITEHVLYSSTGTAADNEGTLAAPVSKLFTPFGFTAQGTGPVTTTTLSVHLKVQRIVYDVTPNCDLVVLWLATTPVILAHLSGWGDMNLLETQGIINDAGAGVSGDIGFFAAFPAAASASFAPSGGYTVVLEMVKGT